MVVTNCRAAMLVLAMQAHRARFADMEWQIKLQETLGAAIDLVEGRLGGATRQVPPPPLRLLMLFNALQS